MADNSGAVDLSKLSAQEKESVKKMAGEQPRGILVAQQS